MGKDFIISILLAFFPAVITFTFLKMIGLKVGVSITGTILIFLYAYLIRAAKRKLTIRKKEKQKEKLIEEKTKQRMEELHLDLDKNWQQYYKIRREEMAKIEKHKTK